MSSRKFAASKIARKFVKREHCSDKDESYDSSAEESEFEREVSYNPSTIRQGDVPSIDIGSHDEVLSEELGYEEEEDDENQYSLDEGSAGGNLDSEDELLINDEGIKDLEAQMEEFEHKEDEVGDFVSLVAKQREEDLRTARGLMALQEQKKKLLALFLKIHPLISLVNQLPPNSLDDDAQFSPYSIAAEDDEIREAFKEAAEAVDLVSKDFQKMNEMLAKFYNWESESINDKLMEIITHWGQKLRQASGLKSGAVLNRPIEQQILAALKDRETLVQPTRRVNEKRMFGVEKIPEFLHGNYADEEFYDRLLREIIAEKSPEVLARIKSSKPTKATLKSKNVTYDIIPELQNYMSATMRPIPDTIDAMLKSLMSSN